MKRSESQSLYNALPEACITYTSNSHESGVEKYADGKILKIVYWKVKKIDKEDIYYPKIVSQILPDLKCFSSEDGGVSKDKLFEHLLSNNRDGVNFLEIDPYSTGSQIIGHIFPKMFYCRECGKIKFLKDDKDVLNMSCDCTGKNERMYQDDRIWVCSCGNIYSIDEEEVKANELKYYPRIREGFIKKDGSIYKMQKKCKCGNMCTLENATDPRVFYPRIITSVKLIENKEVDLCEKRNGERLIIKKIIGKISDEEFEKMKNDLLEKEVHDTKLDEDLDSIIDIDFLGNLNLVSSKEEELPEVEKETLYKMLEYITIKRKVLTDMETAIGNVKKHGNINNEIEIYEMLKKLKIKNISSVSDIEIINTAYGYTRKYKSADEINKVENFKLRAFHGKDSTIPDFYNIRTKTEGIIIDVDKRALYNYLRENPMLDQYIFKECDDEELNKSFLGKKYFDIGLIEKFNEINIENGSMVRLCTKIIYELLHTISHMFINTISELCGINKNYIGEIIFLNAGAILVYSKTSQGAALGAITHMFDKDLDKMLMKVYRDNKICTFDPLCMKTTEGSCCACTYLDEVACEHFNKDLSRRLLYGYEEEGTDERIINFWEEI